MSPPLSGRWRFLRSCLPGAVPHQLVGSPPSFPSEAFLGSLVTAHPESGAWSLKSCFQAQVHGWGFLAGEPKGPFHEDAVEKTGAKSGRRCSGAESAKRAEASLTAQAGVDFLSSTQPWQTPPEQTASVTPTPENSCLTCRRGRGGTVAPQCE